MAGSGNRPEAGCWWGCWGPGLTTCQVEMLVIWMLSSLKISMYISLYITWQGRVSQHKSNPSSSKFKRYGSFSFYFYAMEPPDPSSSSRPCSQHLTARYSRRRTSLSPRHRTRAPGSWHGTRARPVLSSVVTTVTCAGGRGPGVWSALKSIFMADSVCFLASRSWSGCQRWGANGTTTYPRLSPRI